MADEPTPLTVVIATAGQRRDLLAKTLDDLASGEIPAGYQGVLVVENGPHTAAAEVVEAAPAPAAARYLRVPRPHKSAALNLALNRVTPGLVVFLDDDVRVGPRLLAAYADAADQVAATTRGFFGGPIDVDYESPPAPWLVPYLPPSARGWRLDNPRDLGNRCFVGLNWAAFRDDLLALGGFDLNYGPGSPTFGTGEETLAQDQLRDRGIPGRYLPDAAVRHWVPADRCTPEWVTLREYRRSAAKAMMASARPGGRARMRLRLTGRVLSGALWEMAARLRPSPYRKFQAERHRAIVRGLRQGLHAQRLEVAEQPVAVRS